MLWKPQEVFLANGVQVVVRIVRNYVHMLRRFHNLTYPLCGATPCRKIYDAFGTDLGEERPEVEVWTVGFNNVLTPLFGFFAKTIGMRPHMGRTPNAFMRAGVVPTS
eukprot:328632-Amphidinium_carterae.2